MKKILIFILLAACSLSSLSAKDPQTAAIYKARVTYYSSDPKWGNKVSWTKIPKAKEGVTIAAHPKFPFGTKVFIPKLTGVVGDGNFIVQDRGTAVTKKTAANGQKYVFDVYVSNRSTINRLKNKVPMYVDVIVKK